VVRTTLSHHVGEGQPVIAENFLTVKLDEQGQGTFERSPSSLRICSPNEMATIALVLAVSASVGNSADTEMESVGLRGRPWAEADKANIELNKIANRTGAMRFMIFSYAIVD
jgi:hypothetical protein